MGAQAADWFDARCWGMIGPHVDPRLEAREVEIIIALDENYIRYEWGHLQSRNQNADADQLENLALYSARCNQHIQTSMDISEVREWLDGSRIARRIDEVVARRTQLIQSAAWIDLCVRLDAHRRS